MSLEDARCGKARLGEYDTDLLTDEVSLILEIQFDLLLGFL